MNRFGNTSIWVAIALVFAVLAGPAAGLCDTSSASCCCSGKGCPKPSSDRDLPSCCGGDALPAEPLPAETASRETLPAPPDAATLAIEAAPSPTRTARLADRAPRPTSAPPLFTLHRSLLI